MPLKGWSIVGAYEVREDVTKGVWFIVERETGEQLPFGAFLASGLEIARDICFAMNAAHEQRERRPKVAHDGSTIQ